MHIRRPRLLLAAALVVGAGLWVLINGPVEGPTLVELSENHGVTLADLLSVGMVLLAVAIAWPTRD